jgi:hypothetical protein
MPFSNRGGRSRLALPISRVRNQAKAAFVLPPRTARKFNQE